MNLTLTPESAIKLLAIASISAHLPVLKPILDPVMESYPEKLRLNALLQIQAMMVLDEKKFEEALSKYAHEVMDQLMKEVNG